jgi:hypothetical protein
MPANTETDNIELMSREELDEQLPGEPSDPRRLKPGCHPRSSFSVSYNAGMLGMFCRRCGAPVFAVLVGRRRCVN